MAIKKCRIWLPLVNSFTGTARVLSHCARTGRLDGPFAGLMEKIMSKSNDTSKLRIENAERHSPSIWAAQIPLPFANCETTSYRK
jgi:hypothetical protein